MASHAIAIAFHSCPYKESQFEMSGTAAATVKRPSAKLKKPSAAEPREAEEKEGEE